MRDVRASGQGQGEEVKCESQGQVEGRRCKPTAAAHFVNARTACSRVQAIADVWAWISTDLHLSRLTERRDWFGAVRVFGSEEGDLGIFGFCSTKSRRNVRRAAGKHSYLSGRRFPFRHPSLILVRSYAISYATAHIASDHASQGTRVSIGARRQRSVQGIATTQDRTVAHPHQKREEPPHEDPIGLASIHDLGSLGFDSDAVYIAAQRLSPCIPSYPRLCT